MATTAGYYLTRRVMRRLNDERAKGGLPALTAVQLLGEVKNHERDAMRSILSELGENVARLSSDGTTVAIDGTTYKADVLRYAVNEDGSEEIVTISKGEKTRVLLVKASFSITDRSQCMINEVFNRLVDNMEVHRTTFNSLKKAAGSPVRLRRKGDCPDIDTDLHTVLNGVA